MSKRDRLPDLEPPEDGGDRWISPIQMLVLAVICGVVLWTLIIKTAMRWLF